MSEYKKGYLDALKKAAKLFQTHEEGFGDYCDTGGDMEWSCRSNCTEHGIDRLRKHFKEFKDNSK
tara:strand:- start:151 stop:345 length:195 start_codon:yes stop_codon:yes gene_type:complete